MQWKKSVLLKTAILGILFILVSLLQISITVSPKVLVNGVKRSFFMFESKLSGFADTGGYMYSQRTYRFNCKNIDTIKIIKRDIGGGRSKTVDIGLIDGQKVVIKKLANHKKPKIGNDYRDLLFVKEILMRDQLDHPAIIKMMGYCIRYLKSEEYKDHLRNGGILAVYEYGEEFNITHLDLSPEGRLKHAMGLAKLLEYMQSSPVGPLVLGDFNAGNHFLMVDGTIKLIDLDYIHAAEPPCTINSRHKNNSLSCNYAHIACQKLDNDAMNYVSCNGSDNCTAGVCNGMNELFNIRSINNAFFKHLLEPAYFPTKLQSDLKSFLYSVKKHYFDSKLMVKELESIIMKYDFIK